MKLGRLKAHHLYSTLLVLNLVGYPSVAGVCALVGIDSTAVSVGMRGCLLATAVILIFIAVTQPGTKISKSWGLYLFTLFWTIYLVRMFYDTMFRPSLLSSPPMSYWIWAVGVCLLPALAMMVEPPLKAYRSSYWWSFIAMAALALIIAILGGTETLSASGNMYNSGRIHLQSLNPITIGNLGVSLVTLCFWLFISQQNRMGKLALPVLGSCVTMGMFLIVASASRGPMLSLIAVIVFSVCAFDGKKLVKTVTIASLLAVAGYLIAFQFSGTTSFHTFSRVESMLDGSGVSVDTRLIIWSDALRAWITHPILGSALVHKPTGAYPHNLIIESFMATGTVGGLIFVILLIFTTKAAFWLTMQRTQQGWVALIFVQYAVADAFSGAIYTSSIMWTFLAATIALFSTTRKVVRCRAV